MTSFFAKWEKIIKESKMENAKPHDEYRIEKPHDEYRITEREMYERDQRLSCLAHSVDVNRLEKDSNKIIERAKTFYDFIEKGK